MKWLPIKNYEGLYEVSDIGLVRSVDRIVVGKDGKNYPFRGKLLSIHNNSQVGYPQIGLWKNNKGLQHYVHRLVAEAFIDNPHSLPEVNHLDGVRSNNTVDNLEWVTSSGNSLHAYKIGLRKPSPPRMDDEDLQTVLDLVLSGHTYTELAKQHESAKYALTGLSVRVREYARRTNQEDILDAELHKQKVNRARMNSVKYK